MFRSPKKHVKRNGYIIIKNFRTRGASEVYVVSKHNELLILKCPNPNKLEGYDWDCYAHRCAQIENEFQALQLAGDVEGIAHLVDSFEIATPLRVRFHYWSAEKKWKCPDTVLCLLREYIPGRPMNHGEKIMNREHQKFLIETVEALHSFGIVDLDLDRANVIITDSGRPYLIDFGKVEIHTTQNSSCIYNMEKDRRNLENLLEGRMTAKNQ